VFEVYNIDSESDSMLFSLVSSTIAKCRTFKLLMCVHIMNRLEDLDEIVYENNTMLFSLVASTSP
jgi:hypothetical protein